VVVGGGAAGVFGAIRAKTLAPNLKVVVIEKGKPLSKVCGLLHILGQSCFFGLSLISIFFFFFSNVVGR
jgi:flavin-dependent dehydrogenase